MKNICDNVNRADIFTAIIIPPGSSEGRKVIQDKHYTVHIAKFDLVVLIECKTVGSLKTIQNMAEYRILAEFMKNQSKYFHVMSAQNANRINEVDKNKQGVFLFNYFYAEDTKTVLEVWEYTAGWWTANANLTNSITLLPMEENCQYTLINHCRWDNLFKIMPSLIFKPSMRNFVLKNFTANNIVAMPILYKLA